MVIKTAPKDGANLISAELGTAPDWKRENLLENGGKLRPGFTRDDAGNRTVVNMTKPKNVRKPTGKAKIAITLRLSPDAHSALMAVGGRQAAEDLLEKAFCSQRG